MVVDACLLAPVHSALLLIDLANENLFRIVTSAEIVNEAKVAALHMVSKQSKRDGHEPRLKTIYRRLDDLMEEDGVTGVSVIGIPVTVSLPDLGDNHVVAAAIAGRADTIVTANLIDFPAEQLNMIGLEVRSFTEFLLDLADLRPDAVAEGIRRLSRATKSPHMPPSAIVDALVKAGARDGRGPLMALLEEH